MGFNKKNDDNKNEYIIGRNSVREALRSKQQIERIYVDAGADGSIGEVLTLARKMKVIVRETNRNKLDELSENMGHDGKPGNHQGVVAQVPALAYSTIDDVLRIAEQRNEPPFIVVLDEVQDPQNLGAIIRSAEALGAHGVIIGKRRSASLTSAVYKTSSGAAAHIPVVKVTNINQTLDELKSKNIWAFAADMEGELVQDANLTGAVALVVGSEGTGVSKRTKEICDFRVRIDMHGKTQSLNAACATSILLYEKKRQDVEASK